MQTGGTSYPPIVSRWTFDAMCCARASGPQMSDCSDRVCSGVAWAVPTLIRGGQLCAKGEDQATVSGCGAQSLGLGTIGARKSTVHSTLGALLATGAVGRAGRALVL